MPVKLRLKACQSAKATPESAFSRSERLHDHQYDDDDGGYARDLVHDPQRLAADRPLAARSFLPYPTM
jgi:hypothetical protein